MGLKDMVWLPGKGAQANVIQNMNFKTHIAFAILRDNTNKYKYVNNKNNFNNNRYDENKDLLKQNNF